MSIASISMYRKHVYSLYYLLWIIILETWSLNITFSPQNGLVRTECNKQNVVGYLIRETFGTCILKCEQNTLCKSISYNLYSKLCLLKTIEDIVESSDNSPCIGISVDLNVTNRNNPCAGRPCDIFSSCVELDNADGYSCQPMFCPPAPSVDHANLLSNLPTKIGQSNSYICHPGYSHKIRPNIYCRSNGTWELREFKCYPNCPAIPTKSTADLLSWSFHRMFANTTARYSCKPGHYNLTEPVIVCSENGQWSEFTCYPFCLHRNLPVLQYATVAQGDNYMVNAKVQYSCISGYYLPRVYVFPVCKNDGTWTALDAKCNKYCGYPENPRDGLITTLPSTPFIDGSWAIYSCNAGHYPSSQDPYVVCRADGTWQYQGECYRHCGEPPVVNWFDHGQTLAYISTERPYTVSTYAKYECIVTNHLSGNKNDRRTCNRYGGWDGDVWCCPLLHEYDADSNGCYLV